MHSKQAEHTWSICLILLKTASISHWYLCRNNLKGTCLYDQCLLLRIRIVSIYFLLRVFCFSQVFCNGCIPPLYRMPNLHKHTHTFLPRSPSKAMLPIFHSQKTREAAVLSGDIRSTTPCRAGEEGGDTVNASCAQQPGRLRPPEAACVIGPLQQESSPSISASGNTSPPHTSWLFSSPALSWHFPSTRNTDM